MAENGLFRISVEWLRAAEERLGLGFWHWEAETRKVTCSGGLYQLVGIAASSVQVDLSFLESLVHPADRLAIADQAELALDARQVDRAFRLIRPDGQVLHLSGQTKRVYDRDGKPLHVLGVIADITERFELTRRLNRKRALLQAVAQILDGVLWVADDVGTVLELYGPRATEEVLNGWEQFLHADDTARQKQLWQSAVARRHPFYFAARIKRDDGYRQMHVAGLPLSRELSPEFCYGGLSTTIPRLVPAFLPQSSEESLLTPAQVRACRVLLGWTADTLARNAGISVSTVRRIEGLKAGTGQGDSIRQIENAFRIAGLVISYGEGGRFTITMTG